MRNANIAIGTNSLIECTVMTGKLTLPNTLTTIGKDAFRGCPARVRR